MKVSHESQYNCMAQHMEVLPGVQNSGVMSLRDHSTFLEEKKKDCVYIFLSNLRLVFFKVFLISLEIQILKMRHFQSILLGYEI